MTKSPAGVWSVILSSTSHTILLTCFGVFHTFPYSLHCPHVGTFPAPLNQGQEQHHPLPGPGALPHISLRRQYITLKHASLSALLDPAPEAPVGSRSIAASKSSAASRGRLS